MTNTYTTGRASQANPADESLRQDWATAARMNTERPSVGEWVPRRAIILDERINPRIETGIDEVKVREYSDAFVDLPPIQVQRDTFVLLDGNHRIQTAPQQDGDFIRIIEIDVTDGELRQAAFDANQSHGIQLTRRERSAHLSYLLDAHGESWTDEQYAHACGLSRYTVRNHRLRAGVNRQPSQSVPKGTLTSVPHRLYDGKESWRYVAIDDVKQIRSLMLRRDGLDQDAIDEYVNFLDLMPPVTVERGSLILIDGWLRIAAARKAGFDHIGIVEIDVPDHGGTDEMDNLLLEAMIRNRRPEGVQLSMASRLHHLHRLYEKHGSKWTHEQYARALSVNLSIVARELNRR